MSFDHNKIKVHRDGTLVDGSLIFHDDSTNATSWQWKIGDILFSTFRDPNLGTTIAPYLEIIQNLNGTGYFPFSILESVLERDPGSFYEYMVLIRGTEYVAATRVFTDPSPFKNHIVTFGGTDFLPVTLIINGGESTKNYNIEISWVD